ncbi:hypothetical protein PILCRDRAFT_7497 [Piloderma croceum F 1598]|uniref:Uncharacterized protein n=1 Tax=Piloderma croceum (strain F 1598) TaxID=765440 RepID=A0A0C3C0G0_PILCF|nr:hypothetical protein PILCRDRAFT_7497 [Piloderma croceum F 1598]
MGHNSKAKKQLFAKAALARSSRASSGSRHSTWLSTLLIALEDDLFPGLSIPSTPSMSPMPPDLSLIGILMMWRGNGQSQSAQNK